MTDGLKEMQVTADAPPTEALDEDLIATNGSTQET